ncbi:MAG TPA: protein kinase, partial [Polyangiaceae bacterium]
MTPPAQAPSSTLPHFGRGGELPSEPQIGEVLDGKYRIERVVGRGAMAVVLQATHLQLEDQVAIKVLLPQLAVDREFVDRFLREGRMATKIRGEHVVRVFDVGVSQERPYMVMELLSGSDLDRVVETSGPLSPVAAVGYILQACEAIAEAHVAGIVHRDLKPANLFLTRRPDGSDCVKVLDFGISKVMRLADDTSLQGTQPSTLMGSPHYMSPEQLISARDVDPRADIWALGAILYELIVGKPPFDAPTIAALSATVLRDPAPPLHALRPDVPAAVDGAVARCLEKEPAKRFANVGELAWALSSVSEEAAGSAARIGRVLEGGTVKMGLPATPSSGVSGPVPVVAQVASPHAPPARAKEVLAESEREPVLASGRGRMAGYAVAGLLILGAIGAIANVVHKDEAERAAAEKEAASASASAAAPVSSSIPSVPPPAPSASVAIAAPTAAPQPSPTPSAPVASTTPTHAKGEGRPAARPPARRPSHRPGRPPAPHDAPLPDFQVPPQDPSENRPPPAP